MATTETLWGDLEDSMEALQAHVETNPNHSEETYKLAYSPRPETDAEAKELLGRMRAKAEELGLKTT